MSCMKERIETKTDLIDALNEAQRQLDAFLNALTSEQLTKPRDAAGWSIKDHVAHLIAWQNGMTALLQYQPRWPAMGLTADFVRDHEGEIDEINHALAVQYKDMPAQTLLALRTESDAQFRQVIAALGDEQLQRAYAHYQPDEPGEDSGRPIMDWVAENSALHIPEHLAWMKSISTKSS